MSIGKIRLDLCRQISNFLVISLCFFFCHNVFSENAHRLELFDFSRPHSSGCDDPNRPCYKLEDLIKHSLEYGLDSRQEIQLLYQASKNIRVQLGELFPKLNAMSLVSAAMQRDISLDVIVPFVGFLFPSRWFDLRASQRLRSAELESVGTVFANQAQVVQDLYLNIQMQIWSIRVLKFYIHEIERLIEFLAEQRVNGDMRATAEDLAVLENLKAKMVVDRVFIDSLSASFPQLATAVGLDPNVDWSKMQVESHNFASVRDEKKREYLEFWPDALAYSTELKNIKFLIKAAKQNKHSTYFDFFDPASGHDLDFGFGSRIKIARSNIEVLRILLQRTEMKLSNLIHNSLNNHNDAVDAFPALEIGLNRLVDIKSGVENHINDRSRPLDITRVVRHFEYAEGQALRFVNSYFIFRSAQADLNRLTWNGRVYDIVREYKILRMPQMLRNLKSALSFHRSMKNKITSIPRKIKVISHCAFSHSEKGGK